LQIRGRPIPIYTSLAEVMTKLSQLDPAKITPQANLMTDLEMDSIDPQKKKRNKPMNQRQG
jgi:hypothetical protein